MSNACFFLILALFSSCAKQDVTQPREPLNEAYRLMDQGQNAKAIFLLESYLESHPGNKEARVLAASAYMGESGVDIYRSYDSFKDVLFSLPLGERLGMGPFVGPEIGPIPEGAPLEKLVDYADLALGKAKHILSFLSRFPKVERKAWPLIDRALEHMELDGPSNDERLYRTFVQVVYLKSFLDQAVLEDETFGTVDWVCNTSFLSLHDGFVWTLKHLHTVTLDLKSVFPEKRGELVFLHDVIAKTLNAFEKGMPIGTKSLILGFEKTLKGQIRCK